MGARGARRAGRARAHARSPPPRPTWPSGRRSARGVAGAARRPAPRRECRVARGRGTARGRRSTPGRMPRPARGAWGRRGRAAGRRASLRRRSRPRRRAARIRASTRPRTRREGDTARPRAGRRRRRARRRGGRRTRLRAAPLSPSAAAARRRFCAAWPASSKVNRYARWPYLNRERQKTAVSTITAALGSDELLVGRQLRQRLRRDRAAVAVPAHAVSGRSGRALPDLLDALAHDVELEGVERAARRGGSQGLVRAGRSGHPVGGVQQRRELQDVERAGLRSRAASGDRR